MAGFTKTDKQILRDYITANDHLQYTQLPEGVVAVLLTHSNLSASHLDIRLELHSSIAEVKERFRKHIGTPVEHQRLFLKEHGRDICEMFDNTKKLGFYGVTSGMEIHVLDTDPFSLSRGGGLTDTSLIEKYKMSDEAYEKRGGTMREYIKQQRAADPTFKLKPNSGKPTVMGGGPVDDGPPPGAETCEGISVGMRCECAPGARRGTVMYVGEIPKLKPGHWVGIKFDEPVGRADGTVKGERIFACEPTFGAFVRGGKVTVGDFPERDLMDSDVEDADCTGACDDDEDEL
jgi:tubulin-folding cofactor B